MIYRALSLAICGFLCHAAHAADLNSWANVTALRVGDRVGVLESGFKKHAGVLTGVTEEAISVREKKNGISIPRGSVLWVFKPAPNKRLRNTLIGVAAGVGLGVALDQTVGRFLRNESSGDGGRALTYTLPVAGGALLGAFIPAEEVVYRPKSLPGSGKNPLKTGP